MPCFGFALYGQRRPPAKTKYTCLPDLSLPPLYLANSTGKKFLKLNRHFIKNIGSKTKCSYTAGGNVCRNFSELRFVSISGGLSDLKGMTKRTTPIYNFTALINRHLESGACSSTSCTYTITVAVLVSFEPVT